MPVEKIKTIEVIKHVEVPVEKIVERIKEVPVEVRCKHISHTYVSVAYSNGRAVACLNGTDVAAIT